ncbi:obelin-like [Stylophora pistillata]|uniref:obelin-like n=1 Tax=Stylophora pistillata TaxID=50429 RepID=UPI000C04533A|nr:obelin-like [Stylophora pistillata]
MSAKIELIKRRPWVKRIGDYFDALDLNQNGFLTQDEFLQLAENLQSMCKATPLEITNSRIELCQFWSAVGFMPGQKITKSQFTEGFNRLARDEVERKEAGDKALLEQLTDAFFDIMDVNNDGTVTLDERKIFMKARSLDPNAAEDWFKLADRDRNGRVERQELFKYEFDFWFLQRYRCLEEHSQYNR